MHPSQSSRRLFLRALVLLVAYLGLLWAGALHAWAHRDLTPATHIHHTDSPTTCPEDDHMLGCQLCQGLSASICTAPELFCLSVGHGVESWLAASFICPKQADHHTLYLLRGPPAVH